MCPCHCARKRAVECGSFSFCFSVLEYYSITEDETSRTHNPEVVDYLSREPVVPNLEWPRAFWAELACPPARYSVGYVILAFTVLANQTHACRK